MFLDLYWEIHDEWQRRLAADDSIDFEDMLVQAAEHLEAGTIDMGYDLVLVDEFQDASQARARLDAGAGRQARPLPAGRRRRLAVHQPVRRRRHLGDDGLLVLVRRRTDAAPADHVPLPAVDL